MMFSGARHPQPPGFRIVDYRVARSAAVANDVPKDATDAKRFKLVVVDPARDVRMANFFTDDQRRTLAGEIGELWRASCAPEPKEFKPGEAPWAFMSLNRRRGEPAPPENRRAGGQEGRRSGEIYS